MNLPNDTLLQGGKYRIIRFISAGGFGCTYEGVHTMLDTPVAIKEFFVKDFCNRDERTSHVTVGTQSKVELVQKLRRKFVDEAKALYKMQHPNIVRVLDIFEENGTAYYVMDYIDGQSLHEIVKRRGSLSEQDVLRYVEQIAGALQYVHGQNRLHLDIKPGNIMIDKHGKAILIDFGASKQYDEVDGENTSTLLGKTPGYAPIEQMGNRVGTFTPATDIYALGATMYKCLTGDTPPDASDLASGDDLPPLPSSISEYVRHAVCKAMLINKNQRPQSMAEFVGLLHNRPVESEVEEVTVLDEGEELPKVVKQNSSQTFTVNGVAFEMMRVEGGTFTMGATSEQENPQKDENPTHQVTLSSYFIGQTPVTQALWKAVMGTIEEEVDDRVFFGLIKTGSHKVKKESNPSHFKGDNLPVESVSWEDCNTFISKLNSLTGKSFRLPTESEWEFAARGGNNSHHYQYSGSNNLDDVAWCTGNIGGKTHPVSTKQANELGLYDMSGNVWEWCYDWKANYGGSPQTNPKGPASGSGRVHRGGGWNYYAGGCRVANRNWSTSGYRSFSLGFRLAL